MFTRHALMFAVACGGAGPGTPPEDSGSTGDPVLWADARRSPEVEAVWWVTWDTATSGVSHVEFGLDGVLDRWTTVSESATSHRRALIGLKAGRTYSWQAVTVLDDGTELRSSVGELDTLTVPSALAKPDLAASADGSELAKGFLLYSQVQIEGGSWVLIVDGEGDPVWWQRSAPGTMIVTSRPSPDQAAVHYAEWNLGDATSADLHRVELDGSSRTVTHLEKGHHDFYEWPDGKVGFLAYEADSATWYATDAIHEVAHGAGPGEPTVPVFSFLNDHPAEPSAVCSHVTAGWEPDPRFDEWSHSNSLLVDPTGEHYLVHSKFHDALMKIRRSDGRLMWTLNGPYGDFSMKDGEAAWTAVGQTRLWSHGHLSHAYEAPAGSGFDLCVAMFDNGMHYETEASRAIEVCIDETAYEADVTWVYDDPGGGFTPLMGDVRKLDSSWLIGWSGIGRIEEVDSAGEVLWQLTLPPDAWAGRVRHWRTLEP